MCSGSHLTKWIGVAVVLAVAAACATTGPPAGSPNARSDSVEPGKAKVVCHIRDDRLSEISGLAPSLAHPGILWTHNDSGDTARAFAIDANDCKVRAVVQFSGVQARDIEAVATGRDGSGKPVLWLADIGDNRGTWPTVRLYRIPEPTQLADETVAAKTFTVRYPDGSHNAEALLVAPTPNGPMWLATKRDAAAGGIYRIPDALLADGSAVVKRVGGDDPMTTDGSYAPDGLSFVLRTYVGATLFAGPPPGTAPQQVAIPLQRQGEAIAFSADSAALYLAGERSDELWQLPLH